jgi:hypothetical protein
LVNSSAGPENVNEPASATPTSVRGKHRASNVVEGRLRDNRLGDFGAEFQAVEQGDEDSRVCRGQDCPNEQGNGKSDAEHGGDHERDDNGCQEYAGQDEQAQAYGGLGDHTQLDAGAAVEQDMLYLHP